MPDTANDKINPTSDSVEREAEIDEKNLAKSKVGDVLQSHGVTRMEAIYREAKTNRTSLWRVAISVLVCAWA